MIALTGFQTSDQFLHIHTYLYEYIYIDIFEELLGATRCVLNAGMLNAAAHTETNISTIKYHLLYMYIIYIMCVCGL